MITDFILQLTWYVSAKMKERNPSILERQIKRVFALIDDQIIDSVKENAPLPFYDLNELIKLEYENCESPIRLSIKFSDDRTKYGDECDLNGNYFALLWMYKHRKRLRNPPKISRDAILQLQLELYGLWQEDYEEVEEINLNNVESIDAYTINTLTKEISAVQF